MESPTKTRQPRAVTASAIAAMLAAAAGLMAGCSNDKRTASVPAPMVTSPAPLPAPAVSAPVSNIPQYTVVRQLPPVPPAKKHAHRELKLSKLDDGYWLVDKSGKRYPVGRDSSGHIYPAYHDPGSKSNVPLYYDGKRDRYYHVARGSNNTFNRHYYGDAPGTYYADNTNYDNYNPDDYSRPIIDEPKQKKSNNNWLWAIPVLAGAYYLLTQNHHHNNQVAANPDYRYGYPSGSNYNDYAHYHRTGQPWNAPLPPGWNTWDSNRRRVYMQQQQQARLAQQREAIRRRQQQAVLTTEQRRIQLAQQQTALADQRRRMQLAQHQSALTAEERRLRLAQQQTALAEQRRRVQLSQRQKMLADQRRRVQLAQQRRRIQLSQQQKALAEQRRRVQLAQQRRRIQLSQQQKALAEQRRRAQLAQRQAIIRRQEAQRQAVQRRQAALQATQRRRQAQLAQRQAALAEQRRRAQLAQRQAVIARQRMAQRQAEIARQRVAQRQAAIAEQRRSPCTTPRCAIGRSGTRNASTSTMSGSGASCRMARCIARSDA